MGRVVVVGSANVDLVLPVDHLPVPGETLAISAAAERRAGGKGANQAAAAARAGASTTLLAAVGNDDGAAIIRAALAGVDLSRLRTGRSPTGSAVVLVDRHGENSIVIDPGANAELVELTATELDVVSAADVLLGQLETPIITFEQAARRAARTVLNAAPATALPPEVLALVDVLIVNDGEAAALGGADRLLEQVTDVVITHGADGASHLQRGAPELRVPAVRADRVVDTTGAGDAFCGALAAGLADGAPVRAALDRALEAGARAVEYRGALPSAGGQNDTLLGKP